MQRFHIIIIEISPRGRMLYDLDDEYHIVLKIYRKEFLIGHPGIFFEMLGSKGKYRIQKKFIASVRSADPVADQGEEKGSPVRNYFAQDRQEARKMCSPFQ
jgi:hypothetical protein